MAGSEALEWRSYADPLLSMATRSRAVHQSQGRALVLDRFMTHMRGNPDVAATEAWFAGAVDAVRAAADEAGAETAAVAKAFAEPLAVSEDAVVRVVTAAGQEGTIRGEALQLGDLRRTAGNYFRRLGYDKRSLAFDRGEAAPVPDERLVTDVENRLGWAGLRHAVVAARTCTRREATVICAPAPPGTAPEVIPEEQAVAPPLPERSILPGEAIRWFEPKVRAPDLLKRRPGW